MGHSINKSIYDGGAKEFDLNFTLGYLEPEDVTVYVTGEIDGTGAQVYRDFDFVNPTRIVVKGALTVGDEVVRQRTVNKSSLPVDFTVVGAAIRENLDIAYKHSLMAFHELLDQRLVEIADVSVISQATENLSVLTFDTPVAYEAALAADKTLNPEDRALTEGTLVFIRGAITAGDGGHYMGRTSDTPNPLWPNSGSLEPVDPFSATTWGATPDADRTWGGAVTGTDMSGPLQQSLNYVMETNGTWDVPTGMFRLSGDLVSKYDAVTNPTVSSKTGAQYGLTVRGTSSVTYQRAQRGSAGQIGTELHFDDGYSLDMSYAPGQRLENVFVYGRSDEGKPLVDMSGSTTIQRGGMSNVSIINDFSTAPTGDAIALKISELFWGKLDNVFVVGQENYRIAWRDDVTNGNSFFGEGIQIAPEAGGSGGILELVTVAGFDTAVKVGYNADFDVRVRDEFGNIVYKKDAAGLDTTEAQELKELEAVTTHMLQTAYSKTGYHSGNKIDDTVHVHPHSEYCSDQHHLYADGTGNVRIEGGKFGGSTRRVGGVTNYMKNASIVFGHTNPTRNSYGNADIMGSNFGTVTQGGVLVHGGPGNGLITLDRVMWGGNGGALVLLDNTLGPAHVWIKHSRQANQFADKNFSARGVCTFTRNGDYKRHSYTSAPLLARIEGEDWNDTLREEDLDLSDRLVIPTRVTPYTLHETTSAPITRTITLDSTPLDNQDMYIYKRYDGTVNLTMNNTNLAFGIDRYTDGQTLALTDNRVYHLVKSRDDWLLM